MSCYHPILGIPRYNERDNKTYQLVGPYSPDAFFLYPGSVPIPCGHCVGCRLDYSRQWADRMMLELDHSKTAVFLTLTYNEENIPFCAELDDFGLPVWYDLYKPHVSQFMKILRSRKEFEGRQLRFFASGEYGRRTYRPHYHLIVFGLSLDDFPDRQLQKYNELGQEIYKSDFLESVWQHKGFCTVCDVSWNTFAYVSRYVLKKAFNEDLPTCWNSPEFSLMSRRPGIGAFYFQEHEFDPDLKCVYVSGKKIYYPRSVIKSFELLNPDLYAKMKEDRASSARDRVLAKLSQTDLSYVSMLELEEMNKKGSLAKLKGVCEV